MTQRFLITLTALLVPALGSSADIAQTPRDRMLVSTDWVRTHAGDPELVLLHVGDERSYRAGHIPGARLITPDGLSVQHTPSSTLMLEMRPSHDQRAQLEALGIAPTSRVVVYAASDMLPAATRVVFELNALGFGERVSLLDGGLKAWQSTKLPTTADAPTVLKSSYPALQAPAGIVDAAFVQAHLASAGYTIVDARAAAFYDGVQTGGMRGVKHATGHIPGAVNVPFTSISGIDLKVKSADELSALFKSAGVGPDDRLIVYCHVGWQGTAVVFAARSLGMDAVLYDGSFEDWSQRKLPVETSARR